MKPPGTFKLLGRNRRHGARALGRRGDEPNDALDPIAHCMDRSDRIVDSLRMQILDDETVQSLRIRQVFEVPREIFRVEIDRPGENYQRTTLLDRDALEDLLATDDIRERVLDLLD